MRCTTRYHLSRANLIIIIKLLQTNPESVPGNSWHAPLQNPVRRKQNPVLRRRNPVRRKHPPRAPSQKPHTEKTKSRAHANKERGATNLFPIKIELNGHQILIEWGMKINEHAFFLCAHGFSRRENGFSLH